MSTKTRLCAVCDRPINPERVEAVPESRLCLEHAQAIGKYGGEFVVSATSERLSKAGSLKRNYGGVDISKRRNQEAIDKLRADYRQSQQAEGTEEAEE